MHVMQRMTYSFVHLCKSIPKVREKPSRMWRFFCILNAGCKATAFMSKQRKRIANVSFNSKERIEKSFYTSVEK